MMNKKKIWIESWNKFLCDECV